MNDATRDAYARHAAAFAIDWEDVQPPPVDLHEIVKGYSRRRGATADVGCGSGRDAAWLTANGYPRHRGRSVVRVTWPKRGAATPGCGSWETPYPSARTSKPLLGKRPVRDVLVHPGVDEVPRAAERLIQLLAPPGTPYVSWRVIQGVDWRDEHGRLDAALDLKAVLGALRGLDLLLEESTSASSRKVMPRIVARQRD